MKEKSEEPPASGKSDRTRSGVQGVALKTLGPLPAPGWLEIAHQSMATASLSYQTPVVRAPGTSPTVVPQGLASKGTTGLCTIHTCLPVTGRPGAGVWRPKMSPDLLLGILFSRGSSTLTPASQGHCTLAAPPGATQTPKSIRP